MESSDSRQQTNGYSSESREEEYIIELKLWYGTKYERKGEEQVAEYANTRGLKKAYLITFAFLNEKISQNEPKCKTINM